VATIDAAISRIAEVVASIRQEAGLPTLSVANIELLHRARDARLRAEARCEPEMLGHPETDPTPSGSRAQGE
jgi:hypothetical protein